MFSKIYWFEINSWFNKPALYIYAALTLAASVFLMAATVGAFDGATSTVSSLQIANSPNGILQLVLGLCIYLFLLFPAIVGASIHKDFKHNVHKVMYSFPFDKKAYFWGKYLSSITICLFLTLFVFIGVYCGMLFDGVNKEMLGPHTFRPYLDSFLYYVVPGVILFGSIVFAVVTFSRSVVAGFVVMIAIFILQGVLDTALNNEDYETAAALADPFGMTPNINHTKYWTIDEKNNNAIPFTGLIVWNKILWMIIAALILFWSYVSFDFKVIPKGWKFWKKGGKLLSSASHQVAKVQNISLPDVTRRFGFMQNVKSAWLLSKIDLRYILKGGPFMVISILGLLVILLMFLVSGMMFETPTLPTTRYMLERAGGVFTFFIFLLTLVYTGMTINRKKNDNIYQLEDVTPTFNWSFVLSKFITVSLMQAVLFLVPFIGGIIYQIYSGYFDFEIGVYLRDLYLVQWPKMVPWTLLFILIYTLVPNFYVGLVLGIAVFIGLGFLDRLGIEQDVFTYNSGRGVGYSDISGYGWYMSSFYFYRIYWILGGLFLACLGWMTWRRGTAPSFKDWLRRVKRNITVRSVSIAMVFLGLFVSMGYCIYYHNNVVDTFTPSKKMEQIRADYEKTYAHFKDKAQPRIVDIDLDVELYPEEGNLDASGQYTLVNKTSSAIDTLYVSYGRIEPELTLSKSSERVVRDTVMDVLLYKIDPPFIPGDTMTMNFRIKNKENHIFTKYSPVVSNGTFFNNGEFPAIGYQDGGELTDGKTRRKYGMEDKERMPSPYDSLARMDHALSGAADWLSFQVKIGTSPDQIAMAPGNLVKEWSENGRNYFHYKMKRPMVNFYNICSARYEVKKEKWNDVELSIYYHEQHDYNLDRMMLALKDGLDYFSENFGPYQHDQMRILEVPRVGFAQSFANTVPFSENVGFVAQPDDGKEGGVDYTYAITAHELAHQWWGHQVIGAGTQGATMIIEGLSEYSSLKVLEKRYGKDKMRKFLKNALDKYLQQRSMEQKKEQPLMFVENQPYIHYNKGSMVFYAMSEYLGEKKFNNILKTFVDSTKFQEGPYTTSVEFVDMIRQQTPDSLLYLIEDMFENITLYDNRVTDANYTANGDGTYTVDITAEVTKYHTDEKGKQQFYNQDSVIMTFEKEGMKRPIKSYPLSDYVEVGIFMIEENEDGEEEEIELYLGMHKITEIENKYTITVDKEPREVGIDPYNKLIDRDSNDNRRKAVLTK